MHQNFLGVPPAVVVRFDEINADGKHVRLHLALDDGEQFAAYVDEVMHTLAVRNRGISRQILLTEGVRQEIIYDLVITIWSLLSVQDGMVLNSTIVRTSMSLRCSTFRLSVVGLRCE